MPTEFHRSRTVAPCYDGHTVTTQSHHAWPYGSRDIHSYLIFTRSRHSHSIAACHIVTEDAHNITSSAQSHHSPGQSTVIQWSNNHECTPCPHRHIIPTLQLISSQSEQNILKMTDQKLHSYEDQSLDVMKLEEKHKVTYYSEDDTLLV